MTNDRTNDNNKEQAVTQRMPEHASVTKRMQYDDGITERMVSSDSVTDVFAKNSETIDQITKRFVSDSDLLVALELKPNMLISERYRVEEGPLGGMSGEAEIYRCIDEQGDQQIALKLYRNNMAPKEAVMQGLIGLHHADIVRVIDYGTWAGRFFETMEYCEGGSLSDNMPYTEQALQIHIPQIINGLNYCHQQGIIHRDIKPNNLFFRDEDQKETVIGDFGISSIFEVDSEEVKVTHTASNLTLDYAAPELLDGHSVSPKTDYYSLGVTLIHLLAGCSPFSNLNNTDILVSHLRGRIDYPEDLSDRLRNLFDGLLQINPSNRWGYRQILAWLNDEPVFSDDGSEWQKEKNHALQAAYPGFPSAHTPVELAQSLEQFDAGRQLLRGDIRRWIFDNFDTELSGKIEEIEENYSQNPEGGVFLLKYLLNPLSPLMIGNREVSSIRQLVDILLSNDKVEKRSISELLFSGKLAIWVTHSLKLEKKEELILKLRSLAKRLHYKERSLAQIALLYTFDPEREFPLNDSVSIAHPSELGHALRKQPDLMSALKKVVVNEYFEEWIRAADFHESEKDLVFLSSCRVRYIDNHDLVAFSVRWYYDRDFPFPFMGQLATTTKELAKFIDKNKASYKHGVEKLREGWIREWLVSTGRLTGPEKFDHIMWSKSENNEAKMETILHLLDPGIAWPIIRTSRVKLHFGFLSSDSKRSLSLRITNQSRGHLHGNVQFEDNHLGFSLETSVIDSNDTLLTVSLNTLGLPHGITHSTNLLINSNGGDLEIPLLFQVKPSERFSVEKYAAGKLWWIIGSALFVIILMIALIGM